MTEPSNETQIQQLIEEAYTANAVKKAGHIDVVFNAIGFQAIQGVPLIDLDRNDFIAPIVTWTTTRFLTSRAAARHMMQRRSGVILTLSASPARLYVLFFDTEGNRVSMLQPAPRMSVRPKSQQK